MQQNKCGNESGQPVLSLHNYCVGTTFIRSREISFTMHATTTIKATVTDSGTTPAIVVPVHPSAVSQFVWLKVKDKAFFCLRGVCLQLCQELEWRNCNCHNIVSCSLVFLYILVTGVVLPVIACWLIPDDHVTILPKQRMSTSKPVNYSSLKEVSFIQFWMLLLDGRPTVSWCFFTSKLAVLQWKVYEDNEASSGQTQPTGVCTVAACMLHCSCFWELYRHQNHVG